MKLFAIAVITLFAGAPHASAQTSKAAPPKSAAPGNAAAGRKDFMARCSACHGMDARGKTPMADTLGGIPDLHSDKVQKLPDAQIKKTITQGNANMPPVPDVSDADVANFIAFIRSLGKK